jgi:hypothetical protein
MATKTILVSAISHGKDYEDPTLPPFDAHPMNTPKLKIGCTLHYSPGAPQQDFTFAVREQVAFGEDFTASFDVPDSDPHGVTFFWQESAGGPAFRRIAWWDRPREELGKPWGWVGMLWLFDAINGIVYERTACAIALKKFTPWPKQPKP